MRRLFVERMRAGVSRNVFFMGVVSLLNDMASEMIYPIWPFFLTSILGAPVTVVGFIEGVAEASASIFKVFSGWFSDYFQKRKPFVVAGYSLSAISKVLLGFAGSWPVALVGRTSDRFGKGIRTAARDAMIAEGTASHSRGIAFGFHRSMDALGAVVGPLITVALLHRVPLKMIFLLAAIPGMLGVIILISMVCEARPNTATQAMVAPAWRSLTKPFFVFLAINGLFALGNSSDVFLILRSQDVGLSLLQMILVYTLFNVTRSLFSIPAGGLSDRLGPRRVMIWGFLLFSFVYCAFGFMTHPVWLIILFPLYGVFMALTDGVGKAYISNLVPHAALGTAYGVYQVTIGLTNFVASFAAGILWTHISSSAPFFIGAGTALLAALLLLVVVHNDRSIVQ